jgi:Calcineurin-like phosphoesterase
LTCCLAFATQQATPSPDPSSSSKTSSSSPWTFAVSGDSRNCGNVVMPAIAASVKQNNAAFFWHLGDMRAIYAPDEDYKNEPERRGKPVNMQDYLKDAWPDFITHQLNPFNPLPVYLGIGNHELTAPKTRQDFEKTFADYLNAPALQQQRLADKSADQPQTYFHWIQGGIDFIYLDNGSQDQFDDQQMSWLQGVLERAKANTDVHGLIVGMHVALPNSLASGHSMNAWPLGTNTGERVYTELLDFRKATSKPVYVLASHSHFYMSDVFDSDYWRSHGGVLPGWIAGTAGAVRYPLPDTKGRAREHRENIYGYLLVTVSPSSGKAEFNFKEITKKDLQHAVGKIYTDKFIDFCFDENSEVKKAPAKK